ncbi:hypothetical protein GCM10009021_16100 [Halarchaeum nitratireducens]|uniref:Transcriptional regulator n=2 Tax=Halarchaeum nitratireducens TaxID=489913 RepID=A0A830GBD3_9EURY|nr:hypothetical protein GCM10009021_16100 [Halarchaeum nitratireducens]
MYVYAREGSMTDGSAPPTDFSLTDEWEDVEANRTVRERVYEVATTLTEPTAVGDVAERADCGKEGARTHLEWLVDLGVLEKVADNPALFTRHEPYFEFRRVTELARDAGSADALDERLDAYRERADSLSEHFDAATPDAVVLDDVPDAEFEDAADKLGEWRTVERRLREVRLAKLRFEGGRGASSSVGP